MKTDVKKTFALLLIAFGFCNASLARHIAGGEMSYEYLGPGGSATTLKYRITLRLYRDCQSTGAQLDNIAAITIYTRGSGTPYLNLNVPLNRVDVIQLINPGPCIDNPPIVCYQVGVYFAETELPVTTGGYSVSYQRCCRIDNITNVFNSSNTGATYTANIPGTTILPNAPENSTPFFNTRDTVVVCENNPFIYDFSAVDKEGDQLTYSFADAYDGAGQSNPQPTLAGPPPYVTLPYSFGFSSFQPMGPNVSINGSTGIISGVAPSGGIYVITVNVIESRQGVVINIHRKDLHIKVASCSIAAADLQPEYITCDGFTLTFQNRSTSPLITSYFWDFGLNGAPNDTTSLARPTFTFPDTGVYRVMLITNRGQECSDTAYTVAKVFPGFFPEFTVDPGCKAVPLQFHDATNTRYGVVDKWRWSFGNPQINPDTSTQQNPQYIYPAIGTYNVQLVVSNSKGCIDTIDKPVNVLDKPPLGVSNDTLICSIDTLQLSAVGNGSMSWAPNYNINDVTAANPIVSPDVPTKYYVTLSSAPGCFNTDSVFVDVKRFVTLNAGADTTICLTDTVRLNPATDALNFHWTPATTLDNPDVKNPVARPTATTIYTLVANIGKCQATDGVVVRTVPYPTVIVNDDTVICYGDRAQLFASGGVSYRWLPATGLNRNNIPSPVASPEVSTSYIIAVTDNLGCPKPAFDSVHIRVVPPVPAFAGNDTAVVIGQLLQLNATGAESYVWSPPTGLSNSTISNPVANLNEDITYTVRISTEEGCFAYDSIRVRVFKTNPDIFVPTAFTPNHDGLNDQLIPIPVGISEIDYFRVYNRWGQLVFSAEDIGKGWDGRISGKEQGSDSFVWYVKGTDFTGKIVFKKGSTTLIR